MGQPRKTLYRVAEHAGDFRACHAILRAHGEPEETLHHPAVVAERDGQILGFASSSFPYGYIALARLLALPGPHSAFMTYRLLEAYENLLRRYNVQAYLLSVDAEGPLRTFLSRLGMLDDPSVTIIEDGENGLWMQRQILGVGLYEQEPTSAAV